MQTTTVLFTTGLLVALASAQKTVVYTGEPEQFVPTFTLNPTQSAIISKYATDVGSAFGALMTNPAVSGLEDYLATNSALVSDEATLIPGVYKGNPLPTNAITQLPASLRDPVVSAYDAIASVAKADLSADPALTTVAPFFVAAGVETDRPKITRVEPGSESASGSASGSAQSSKASGEVTSTSTSFATVTTSSVASGSGSGAAGVAAPSGVASGSGVASQSGSGVSSPPATATSPIASAKASNGASRVGAGVGGLLAVGLGFLAWL